MSEEDREIQSIDWRRCFAFLEILRSFRMSIHPAALMLCLLGLVASVGLAILVDQAWQTGIDGRSLAQNLHYTATTLLWGEWALPYVDGKTWDDFLVFLMGPVSAGRELVSLAVTYWERETWFALVTTLISLGVWAFVGTAVSRMAAVRVAREESVSLKQALAFSCRKWPSTVTSPLIPFGVLVFVAVLVGLPTGLVAMIPYVGEWVVGLLLGLTLLMGFVMSLIFIGGVFSVGLQWPTIAAEGSDSFDAISRSVSYISSRPWKYLFYNLFSILYGCATFIFVKLMAFLTLWLTHEAISKFTWGTDTAPDKLARLWQAPTMDFPWPQAGLVQFGAESSASYVYAFWVWVVLGLTVAFLCSFFYCSQTVIYFLLRKRVDATDIEEVYMEESEEDELPVETAVEKAEPQETPEEEKAEEEVADEPPPEQEKDD